MSTEVLLAEVLGIQRIRKCSWMFFFCACRAFELMKNRGQRSWSVGLSVADITNSILTDKMKTHSVSTLAQVEPTSVSCQNNSTILTVDLTIHHVPFISLKCMKSVASVLDTEVKLRDFREIVSPQTKRPFALMYEL